MIRHSFKHGYTQDLALALTFLSEEQTAKLCTIIEAGADLERDGVVRYRRIDLVKVIERESQTPKR
jgi:hypothetical protein